MLYLKNLVAILIIVAESLLFFSCSDKGFSSENIEISSGSIGDSSVSAEIPLDLEWTWVSYDDDRLRYSGRINYEKGDYAILSWSGTSVTVAFVGVAVEARLFATDLLYLDVFVDENEEPSSVVKLDNSENVPYNVLLASDLPYGLHTVTLYKRTESNISDLHFLGMNVLGLAGKEFLPKEPKRKIEFIGNSITCGTDVLMPVPKMAFDIVYENSYYGYAGQTAKRLNADAHIICSAGHGVYINFDGSQTYRIPEVYEKTGTMSPTVVDWDHSKWHPDVVVMNLGTNDIASGKNDSVQFVAEAVKFVRLIRSYHPDSKIVLLDGPMLTGNYMVKCRSYLDKVKSSLEALGLNGLYRYSLQPSGVASNGVLDHPDKAEAARHADSLSSWMRFNFGWK